MKPGSLLFFILLACVNSFTPRIFAQQETEVTQAATDNSFLAALTGGQIKALFRYSGQYRASNLHVLQDSSTPEAPNEEVQQYSAIGGFIGYETAPWFHTTVGATVYGAVPFGHNPADRRGLGGLYEADGGQDAYAALGEVFIKFQNDGHLVEVGRQEVHVYRNSLMENNSPVVNTIQVTMMKPVTSVPIKIWECWG